MREISARKPERHIVPLIIFVFVLTCGVAVHAQSQTDGKKQGLHIDSPPSVLNDPIVKRCRLLAARRMDPTLDSFTTAIDRAVANLEIAPIFDAVSTCRAALMAYPNEPKIIIAHDNASEHLSARMFGLNFPDADEQALALALQIAGKKESATGTGAQLVGFFLGSAYEYGVGTEPNRAAAIKWYTLAAEAGDPISKRELARWR
jgi:hypothetical protein